MVAAFFNIKFAMQSICEAVVVSRTQTYEYKYFPNSELQTLYYLINFSLFLILGRFIYMLKENECQL